jgi:hypothetical protein
MSSVDYGKYKENKIKRILREHESTQINAESLDLKPLGHLSELIIKIQKLFSFYSSNCDDPEVKSIIKDELDRLLRDALLSS